VVRWKGSPRASALPGERFIGAMRVGLNYAVQAPRLKLVLLRVFLFFLQSTALLALLPLVAQGLHGGGAGFFTVMLSCLGLGAVIAALYFPRWRARYTPNQFVVAGTLVHAAAAALIVGVPEVWVALPAMVVAGMAWISVANSLTLAAQSTMPDWVRARGMSIYQMALMGGAAAGALLWGQVASFIGVNGAVLAGSVFGVLASVALRRTSIIGEVAPDFSPAPVMAAPEPSAPVDDDAGPVMVTVEYLIDPARADAFSEVMERTRRARLRQGALSWGLFHDVAQPGRCIEYFVDENWLEHQRRLERFTAFDAELREQRLAFHLGSEPPTLSRYVADGRVAPPGL